jgi:hypothetical protein
MVVQSDSLPVGSLFIITCTGGTIGRDTDLGHSIVIPDPLVSKVSTKWLLLHFKDRFENDCFLQFLLGGPPSVDKNCCSVQ